MAGPRFKLSGINKAVAQLKRLPGIAQKVIVGAALTEAELIMTAAKQRTPVQTGALRASGHVRPPKVVGTKFSIEMGFGGVAGREHSGPYNVGYAVWVHEGVAYQPLRQRIRDPVKLRRALGFLRSPVGQQALARGRSAVGGPKFLESAVNEAKAGLSQRLVRRAQRRLEVK